MFYQSADRINEIEGYAAFLGNTLRQSYSADQRALFSAAIAERWLSAYKTSSQKGQELDWAVLREAMDAAWNHLRGKKVTALDFERYRQRVLGAMPGADPGEISRVRIMVDLIQLVLECCAMEDNSEIARQVGLAVYDAVVEPVPGYPSTEEGRRLVWRQPGVMGEISRQQSLLAVVAAPITGFVIDYIIQQSRADTLRLDSTHLTLAMNLPEPDQLPGFFSSAFERLRQDIPAEDLGGTLEAMLGDAQSGSPSDHLRKLAAASEESMAESPGMAELPGVFQRLASFWDGLQKNTLPLEFSSAFFRQIDQLTSKTEKEHQDRLSSKMSGWKPEQRLAFTAALAERWLKAYEVFSTEEGWGDVALLQKILVSVWEHLEGHKLTRARRSTYSQQVIENAPDTEAFDAPQALTACELLDDALECCAKVKNLDPAVGAAMAACSCLAMMAQGPGYRGDDLEEEERLWNEPAVGEEITWQLSLLEKVDKTRQFDHNSVEALRSSLRA